jgi:hypothetical protein
MLNKNNLSNTFDSMLNVKVEDSINSNNSNSTVRPLQHNNIKDNINLLKKVCNIQQPGSLSKNYFYNFNPANRYKIYKLLSNIIHILNYFFGTFYGIISKPVFLFSQSKLTIYINYYLPKTSNRLKNRHMWKYNKLPANSANKMTVELKKLLELLSKLLNLEVSLELNKLKYPYHDSTILSKLIALNTNKTKFHIIMLKLFKKASIITSALKTMPSALTAPKGAEMEQSKNNVQPKNNEFLVGVSGARRIKIHQSIPTILTGLKIQISGRLITQRVVPKRTISKKEIGGFKKTKNSIVDYALYTNKNKRGAYSVKVWTTSKICI